MNTLGAILVLIGFIGIALAKILGIGIALYMAGVADYEIGYSLWTGFCWWASLCFSGLGSLIFGYVLMEMK